MKLILLRHAATAGNLEKRYIGRTDETLCESGIVGARGKAYPEADILFSSPMTRCLQTAKIIYPHLDPVVTKDFRECNFGDFEGKNYAELTGRTDYQAWIDSDGTLCFPNGEDPSEFRKRCVKAYDCTLHIAEDKRAAYIVHGGTIMSIMERYEPSHDYYKWQCKNACGYIAEFDGQKIKVTDII